MFSQIEKLVYKKERENNKLLVGEVSQTSKSNRLLLCVFKGLLIFIASYCSIAALLDTFNISFSRPIIIAGFLFFSMYVALLYFNKIVFYIFYIFLFLVFTIELARYYLYANSGFQAAINIISKEYSDYFALPVERQAQEVFENRYMTVTVAALFLGVFIIILLNVTISGYMNTFETMLVTFPLVEVCLFIHKIPSIRYIFGLLFVYTCVTFLQFSGHSRMQVKGKHTHEYLRIKRKKSNSYSYQADTSIFLYTFGLSGIITLAVCLVLSSALTAPTNKQANNPIHEKVQEYVKIVVQSGMSGLLDRYSSKGGLAEGSLGGVSQVRPDFLTDLEITYVPVNYNTVYLKGYTASDYHSNLWSRSAYNPEEIERSRVYPYEEAKMIINNIDAEPQRITFAPYYSDYEIDYKKGDKSLYEITYYPNYNNDYTEELEDELLKDPDYYKYVYETCLSVPEDIQDTLDETLSEVGNVESYTSINDYRIKTADSIYDYFLENYSYTMAPGSTPVRKDYVEYFLTTQKRGFCAHFASATVMLLREKGIPARYCEGYSVPLTLVSDSATVTNDDPLTFYNGPIATDRNVVVSVPVNDSYAHAWVEIYLDGYGFVPYEATIPSFDEENVSLSLTSLFSFLNVKTNTLEDSTGGNGPNIGGIDTDSILNIFKFETGSVAVILFPVIGIIISTLALYFLGKWITIRIRLAIFKAKGNEYEVVKYEYTKIIKKLRRKKLLTKKNPLPEDVKEAYDLMIAKYNNTHNKQIEKDTRELFDYYERILYSK